MHPWVDTACNSAGNLRLRPREVFRHFAALRVPPPDEVAARPSSAAPPISALRSHAMMTRQMAGKRFIMNAGRTTKQGQQINAGKDYAEYRATVSTLNMHPQDMREVGIASGSLIEDLRFHLIQLRQIASERHLLATFESSVARQHGIGDEEPSTLNIEEQAKRRSEGNVAGDRQSLEIVGSHGFAAGEKTFL
jgi:hypothetical protein